MKEADKFDDLEFGATVRSLSRGQRLFERYRLVERLGKGGMGVVWKARDEVLDHEVALKFVDEFIGMNPEAVEDLKRETRKCLKLQHPNIVRIQTLLLDGAAVAIAMEYVDGQTFSTLKIQQPKGCFEVSAIRRWTRQLCEALDYAHRDGGLVHRDLKPANLMVNSAGQLRVLDFGIARSLSDSKSQRSTVASSGLTPAYSSPQQMYGERPCVADDLYAIGATLYDLLTGKPPFNSGNIVLQVKEVIPAPVNQRRQELGIEGMEPVPQNWEETIAACLEKDPAKRPPSAIEVAYRLGLVNRRETKSIPEWLPKPEVVRVAGPRPAGPAVAPAKRGRGAVVAMASTLLAVGALAGWWYGVEQPRREAAKKEPVIVNPTPVAPAADQVQLAQRAVAAKIAAALTAADDARTAEKWSDAVHGYQAVLLLDPGNVKAKEGLLAVAEQQKAVEAAALAKQKAEAVAKRRNDGLKAIAEATMEHPYENSLGMKFVPVPGTKVLFSIWDTRVKDFRAYVEATGYRQPGGVLVMKLIEENRESGTTWQSTWKLDKDATWEHPGFMQGEDHPVVGVNWVESNAFCEWLTAKERKEGRIGPEQKYRLPKDEEWSAAVGDATYPWGNQWPPPDGAGNFFDYASAKRLPGMGWPQVPINDGYPRTSPVGSFKPNRLGLYDMGGNVWQWCEDWYRSEMNRSHEPKGTDGKDSGYFFSSPFFFPSIRGEMSRPVAREKAKTRNDGGGHAFRTGRGGSWADWSSEVLASAFRNFGVPEERGDQSGFRCVLTVEGSH